MSETKKPTAKKTAVKKRGAQKREASGVPAALSFWDRWAAAYRSMREDPRIQVVAPSRLAHSAANVRMLRLALEELAEKSGSVTDALAPFAGDFFYTALYWLGPKDENGLHPFGGEVRLQGASALLRPLEAAPGWALFDDHPMAGDGVVTVIRPLDGGWQLGVLEHGSVEPLELDVPGYMQGLLDLRGAFGWQWLFVDDHRSRRTELSLLLDRVEEYFSTETAAYRARIR